MKLDYQLLKDILTFIESDKNAHAHSRFILDDGDLEKHFSGHSMTTVTYHFQILNDDGLIHGFRKFSSGPGYSCLTAQGHRVLESMKNDTLWNKIKDGALSSGIDSLKQIPALAVQMLLTGIAK